MPPSLRTAASCGAAGTTLQVATAAYIYIAPNRTVPDLQLLYGKNSHNTGTVDANTGQPTTIQFVRPREMMDGRIMALVRQNTDQRLRRRPHHHRHQDVRREHPGGARERGHDSARRRRAPRRTTCARSTAPRPAVASTRASRCGTARTASLRAGRSAACSTTRDTPDDHRALHGLARERSERRARAAAV